MEQYNIWLGTQESGDSEIVDKTSVDNQVQELVPDISKMKLAKAIEKNVITEEYLNNLSTVKIFLLYNKNICVVYT